jgi:glucose-1-phosphate adenylyltransferase
VRINSFADVDESILFEGVNVGRHAMIRRAIIDKNVEIPPGLRIGYDREEDRKRFFVSPEGIVVVPKGMRLSD